MKKILSAIGKKNIIIISGILLIGIAIYLDLTLKFDNAGNTDTGYIMENGQNGGSYDDDDYRGLGQAALVNSQGYNGYNGEDMGAGAGGAGIVDVDVDTDGIDGADEYDMQNSPENYFAVSVVSRQRARDESIELLNNIVDSAETMPDVKDRALSDIQTIAVEIEKEANIEVLIKAKGFVECVAVVNGENANVIVKTDGLMANEVAQIKEIVYEQSGILPANTRIIEKN